MKTESVVARESQHTPFPWHVSGCDVMASYESADGSVKTNRWIATVSAGDGDDPTLADYANAEFIVRACNSHTKLVEALQAARNSIIAAKHPLECPNDETARGLALMELRDRLEAINVLLSSVEAI